ncbi:ABC transporter permease [Rhodohalobacter barkolensis]|uniref:ABC transporter permease n=1 Tax=Rhodohalobacter barkolensis TaxID=2053187 RepID=A0A2N0VJB5_9BACT|nr:ABC transporter permease [Rhodohalobacter barkolensis]PKD44295.1 ABC transporter permease [Rhodohalobacter barkolensis]
MNWRQTYLVLKREYLTRVRSKGFIWATILVPLGFAVFIGVGIFIAAWDSEIDFTIGVYDETGEVIANLQGIDENRYIDYSDSPVDTLRAMVQREEITGYVLIDDSHISENENLELIYSGSGGLQLLTAVRSDFRESIRQERLRREDVSEDIRNIFESRVEVDSRRLSREGEETDDDTEFLSIVGMFMGLIIFGAIFGYGGYIMRGVIEEKTNRIIEVIASSVKPIELLTGKMAGVGAIAITQFGIWLLAFAGLSAIAGPLANSILGADAASSQMSGELAQAEEQLPAILDIPTLETSLIVYFVIFFFLGYLLYSSLFAAIGSAADSETDTQQLMLPISAPIFIAYIIMFHAMQSPDSTLSVVGSLIPFFSPILMITRIAITEVPFWQTSTAILLMMLTFVGTMWLSSKIYQVGILSYGKTASFKDLAKWIKRS